MITPLRIVAAAVIAAAMVPAGLAGQSVLDRPPNVSGDWVVRWGVIQFNFQHRFDASPPPARKVTNYPTFVMAAGLPVHTMVGFTLLDQFAVGARVSQRMGVFRALAPSVAGDWCADRCRG